MLCQRVRDRLPDRVRHRHACLGGTSRLVDEREQVRRVDFEVAVDLWITWIPPDRGCDPAPTGRALSPALHARSGLGEAGPASARGIGGASATSTTVPRTITVRAVIATIRLCDDPHKRHSSPIAMLQAC